MHPSATVVLMTALSLPPIVPISTAATADGSDTVICDVRAYLDDRVGYDAFTAGHIPGARHVDLDSVLAAAATPGLGRHPLPDPSVFADGLSKAGIGHQTHVLAYDDAGGMIAGRLVWMLRTLGQNAAVLDGGISAWDGELEVGAPAITPVDHPVRTFPNSATVTADEVEASIAAGGLVIDVRAPDRYAGKVEPIDPVAGHIDGAINAPFADNLSDGHFRPIDELAAEYTERNVDKDTIYYCGSGVSACHSMLVAEAVGLGRGLLYVASWSGHCTR